MWPRSPRACRSTSSRATKTLWAINGKGMKSLYDAYKRAAIFDVRLKLYPGARHETLNETNRQEVTDDFIAWCDEIIAAQTLVVGRAACIDRAFDFASNQGACLGCDAAPPKRAARADRFGALVVIEIFEDRLDEEAGLAEDALLL